MTASTALIPAPTWTSNATVGSGGGNVIWTNFSTSSTSTNHITITAGGGTAYSVSASETIEIDRDYKVKVGERFKIKLPDGAVLQVEADGSYALKDDKARIKYHANRFRAFNRYVNASDLLEEFMKYVATVVPDIKSRGVLGIPLELLIKWVVIRAAEADKEPTDPEEALALKAEVAAMALKANQARLKRLAPPQANVHQIVGRLEKPRLKEDRWQPAR